MLILFNGHIYSEKPEFSGQTALAIEGNVIKSVGTDKEILNQFSNTQEKIDLGGKFILPGLTDSHLHLVHLSQSIKSVDCETPTLQECLNRIAIKAQGMDDESWIKGHGWNHNIWENRSYGTAAQLDSVSCAHPVLLYAKSLHAIWVNSAVLSIAGIDENTPDPDGGQILRDKTGKPNGILLESAMNMVIDKINEPKSSELSKDFLVAQSFLASLGITGVHDFDGPDSFRTLQMLQKEGNLRIRVNKNLPIKALPYIQETGLHSGFGNDMLHMGSLKLFADGALGPQTAAMLDPYEGSHSYGQQLLSTDEIFEAGVKAAENGWSLSIHAIGDLANRVALDGFFRLRQYELDQHLPRLAHRIEHVQLINERDQQRLAEMDITASVQPIHCTSDMIMVEKYWGSRAGQAYAFRSLLECGTKLVFGSDAPVESPNPFFGIHAAVTRRRHDGKPGEGGWHPEQKISLTEAIHGYTAAPAELVGLGHCLGKIKPGYLADLIVLDKDPFFCDEQDLFNLAPCMTIVDGCIVFQK